MFRRKVKRLFSFETIHKKMMIRDSYLKESVKFNERYNTKCRKLIFKSFDS